jgi:hypothetical protein
MNDQQPATSNQTWAAGALAQQGTLEVGDNPNEDKTTNTASDTGS